LKKEKARGPALFLFEEGLKTPVGILAFDMEGIDARPLTVGALFISQQLVVGEAHCDLVVHRIESEFRGLSDFA
jgi:hypothetical protein